VRVALALTLAAPLTLAMASPAAAACSTVAPPDPDGKIRHLPDGGFFGGGGYSQGGIGFSIDDVAPRESVDALVKYKNVSEKTRGIVIRATLTEGTASHFRIKAFAGGVRVEDQLFSPDGFKFPGIAPGKSTPDLVVKIKVLTNAAHNEEFEVGYRGVYGSSFSCGDFLVGGGVVALP
jgi:hypothetical protein